jgi:hypothetical protein
MSNKLKALMLSLGLAVTVTAAGVVSVREFFAPRTNTTNAQLIDAGIMDCPLRTIRVWAFGPNGRLRTQEAKARVCSGEPVVSRDSRDLVAQGWTIYRVRDLGAATGSETELADVAPECMCTNGVGTCNAQRRLLNGNLAAAAALPRNFVAGPDQLYVNPAGAGCVAMPCIESGPGFEWPATCPKF